MERIVSPPDDWSWVNACRVAFEKWTRDAGSLVDALQAIAIESDRIADILDWSFQKELDTVAFSFLGRKKVGLHPQPQMDATVKLLTGQRNTCDLS